MKNFTSQKLTEIKRKFRREKYKKIFNNCLAVIDNYLRGNTSVHFSGNRFFWLKI